jgi:methionyl-tRNA formyltransferase
MKIIFFGTSEFAIPSLRELLNKGENIVAVITQTDKPAGRSCMMKSPPVKIFAGSMEIPVHQFKSLKKEEALTAIQAMMPDIAVVAAYGKIIPSEVLKIPQHGFINVHPSLLPAYRGASPIQTAIIRGEKETGVTIMQLDEGMDTGDILMQKNHIIEDNDTAETMHEKLSELGALMVVQTIELLKQGKTAKVKQDHSKATYTKLLEKTDGEIDWHMNAREIYDFVRGMYSWPCAYTFIRERYIKIFPLKGYKEENSQSVECGKILGISEDSLRIQAKNGLVDISEVQLEGKKRLPVTEFIKGFRFEAGEFLGKKT